MNIISNINDSHLNSLALLSQDSDELVIFSPFCYQDFYDFLEKILFSNIKKVSLVTTLTGKNAVTKCNSLVSFIDCLNAKKVKWKISIDNKLHGKLYFFKKEGKTKNIILTSSNVTENGMRINHEWGYIINNNDEIKFLELQAQSCIEKETLSEEDVINLMVKVDEYLRLNKNKKSTTEEELDINDILKKETGINFPLDTRIFLKPIGSIDDKIFEGDFSGEEELYFSRRRPNAVRINDILICYGVGSTKLISVFKVLSEPIKTNNPLDRWPWYVNVENLSTSYGKTWFNFNNTLAYVMNKYFTLNPNGFLTFNEGKTLGALNFGADKIRLNQEFGEFLINTIIKSPLNNLL